MIGTRKLIALALMLSLTLHFTVEARHGNKFLAAIGSAKGIAVIAFAYNMLNGCASWVWAYDWTRNNVTNVETKAQIQEAGGLTSAGLTWTLGSFVPLYGALYVAHMKRHQEQNAAEAPQGNRILVALSSPLGIAIVAFVYQTLRGAATFVWAYDWTRYGVADAEAKTRIQEAGGMASAGLAWLLGGLIPFYCYLYSVYLSPDNSNLLPVPPHSDAILNMLSTPKGIAAVAFVVSLLDGATSYVWAYNWMRDGHSAEMNARIEEAGGLASAVLCWTIGGFVPFYLYLYMNYRERLMAHGRSNAAAGIMRQVVLDGT